MITISRLRKIRNWMPAVLFVLIVCAGVLFLKITALSYLLILFLAATIGTLSRMQLTYRERFTKQIGELNQLAYYDELTGLFNRRKIIGLLQKALDNHAKGYVLLIDLDGFKLVNDSYGHHAGDQILVQTADRLRDALGEGTLLARLGGDEFLVVSDGSCKPASLISLIKSIVSLPFKIEGDRVRVGASIGAADFNGNSQAVGDLLRLADRQMYLDKTRRMNLRSSVASAPSKMVVQTRNANLFKLINGHHPHLSV